MNVLIVDDDFVNRTLLQEFLKPYGGLCHLAANGPEALIAVDGMLDRQTPYDLICLDVMMPGMDGHDVLRKIREMERQRGIGGSEAVKILMISALDDGKTIMQSLVRGSSDGYLTKPLDLAKMKKVLADLGFRPASS